MAAPLRCTVVMLMALWACAADAFPIGPVPPAPSIVVEYFNTTLGHYFYTLDPNEIAAIDAGSAGPGWAKTGLVFFAFPTIASSGNANFATCDQAAQPCVGISRFYGTPGLGPNSHFFTGNADEAASLKRPGTGWSFEEIAFVLPLPDAATGQCAADANPVYRMYNGRARFNDTNHRYTASADARARMLGTGWIDEGIAFCSYGRGTSSIESYSVQVSQPLGIMDISACDAPTATPRSCIATSNLPVPTTYFAPASQSFSDQLADEFGRVTRVAQTGNVVMNGNYATALPDRLDAARDVFVQLSDLGSVFGLHLATLSKVSSSPYTSITPMVRLPDVVGQADARVFPFRVRYGTAYELRGSFGGGIELLSSDAGSAAYGVWSIEYQDNASGHRLRANVLAYGSVGGSDSVARDAKDGVPIVGTTFRVGSPYGTDIEGAQITSVPMFNYFGYAWFVNRDQFAATLQAARAVDPQLSAEPENYFIRHFGVINEAYNAGEMGLYIINPTLTVAPVQD